MNNFSYQYNTGSKIELNFFEILLSQFNLDLSYTDYSDKETLKKLRLENPQYFFHRSRNYIYSWPIKNVSANKFTDSRSIVFDQDSRLFAKIIQIGTETFLKDNGFIQVGSHFRPEFIRRTNLCPDIPGIAIYNKLALQTRLLKFGSTFKIGYLISVGSYIEFTESIKEIMDKKIDPRNMLIKTENNTKAVIEKVDGVNVILDTGESVMASICIPIANTKNQLHYLSSIGMLDRFRAILDKENNPEAVYSKVQRVYEFLKKYKKKIFLVDDLLINDILSFAVSGSSNNLKKDMLSRPVRFYSNNQREKYPLPSNNLKELGTFSELPKKINLFVISPEEYKGNVEIFLKKISLVLKSFFHVDNINIDDQYFSKNTSVNKGYDSLLYNNSFDPNKYDVALIIISEDYRQLSYGQDPYLTVKASLMGDKIPSQEVEIETIKSMNLSNEVYILNNIALALYGKVGGTAWAIDKLDPIRAEFIIGIGSSTVKNENGQSKKFIGFATVFDFTGRYVVGECSSVTTLDNYKDALQEHITSLIAELITKNNIQKNKEIRLIFHLFKPAGEQNEIRAIEESLAKFDGYKIEYAILHLNENHNFRVFADKGKVLPQRGLLISVSEHEKILCFVSRSFHKQITGNPTPILIDLDKRSSFKDLDYLIKQVFYFSFLSSRSFIPSKTPITILYPTLLANLTGRLQSIPSWNYKKLALVKDKLWFI